MSQLHIYQSPVSWIIRNLETDFRSIAILVIFLLTLTTISFSQSTNIKQYQFISPVPGSTLYFPETSIIIRQGDIIDRTTLDNSKVIVVGSKSGFHQGEFFIADDMRTLIFEPDVPYFHGEKVNVKFFGGLRTINGDVLNPVNI